MKQDFFVAAIETYFLFFTLYKWTMWSPRDGTFLKLQCSKAQFRQTLFSPLHPYPHRTQRLIWVPWCDSRKPRGLGALVWQPQPSFSISDRSCLMTEKSRQNASRIARRKMKTECERHGERESERRREDRATKLSRTRKTIRCYQSEQ